MRSYLGQAVHERSLPAVALVIGLARGVAAAVPVMMRVWLEPPWLYVLVLALFLSLVSDSYVARGMERAIASGAACVRDESVAESAHAVTDFEAIGERFEGRVSLGVESWTGQSNVPVRAGQSLKILRRDGLKLPVRPRK